MKDLSLQLEKMLAAVQKKRSELEDEVTETQAAQIELDKTAEDFRKLHKERSDLVAQWESAVGAMQKRDEAIQRAHEEFVAAKRQLREKQEVLTEREAFLTTEQKNNAEVELKIASLERTIAKKRETLTCASAHAAAHAVAALAASSRLHFWTAVAAAPCCHRLAAQKPTECTPRETCAQLCDGQARGDG
jgi:DNA repair exonuclease SbcCD ATPase subunit